MLKFFLKRNKQPQGQAENATGEESTTDQLPTVNYLEEVLKPLFERIQPTAPEEYIGMYSLHVIVIHCSQVVRKRKQPPLSDLSQHEHFK